jgi:hypothetical protein
MKQLLSIIALVVFSSVLVIAQQNPSRNVDKKKQPTGQPTGNPGDSRNAQPGRDKDKSDSGTAGERDDAQDDDDNVLLGDDNEDDETSESSNDQSNYRNNRVNGNPNNRNINKGSNRRGGQRETDESPTADENDSTTVSGGRSQENVSGVLIDETTSGSGSPAMRQEGSDRDGTNNVQRAKPNMAGSRVDGMRHSRKTVDPDREIRNGSQRQQNSSTGNDVSRSRRAGQQGDRMKGGQQGDRMRNQKSKNGDGYATPQTVPAEDDEGVQTDPSNGEPQEPTVTETQSSPDKDKKEKKSRKKKRKDRD